MKLLFVTSFAPDMYQATGVHLVRTFLESGSDGTLLVCQEQQAAANTPSDVRLRKYDLDESQLLGSWLLSNRDIIPTYLGGSAEECDCPAEDAYSHRPYCPWGWFNRNASRWFRKIVSLHHALGLPDFDAVVWLDSDCKFVERLPADEVAAWFGSSAVFYHKSQDRNVVESGVIGFRMNEEGRRFLCLTIDRYRSGEFREHARWDDGYQFQVTLDRHPEIPSVDLATRAEPPTVVLPSSPAGKYLLHEKGVHAGLSIML